MSVLILAAGFAFTFRFGMWEQRRRSRLSYRFKCEQCALSLSASSKKFVDGFGANHQAGHDQKPSA